MYQAGLKHFILDRSIVSADVYRHNTFSESIWQFWLDRFCKLEGYYIWVSADYSVYLDMIKRTSEEESERRMTREVYEKRHSEFARYFMNIRTQIGTSRSLMIFNDGKETLYHMAEEIIGFIEAD